MNTIVRYTAKELIEILGVPKIKYSSLINSNNLICSYPSSQRGVSHKYSEDDVKKNIILVELLNCGFSQKQAYSLATNADVNAKEFTAKLGTASELRMELKILDSYESKRHTEYTN